MCLFPRPVNPQSALYQKGIHEFACGVCPECLSRRARQWALRASMEAKVSPSCMITLTYDNYVRDKRGNVIGELPPDRDLHVSKRDCQLFFKRLRRAYPDKKIKYICTAEYGKHTHRAHYHVLLFGLCFDDLILKGKSKRGNLVYRSPTLSRLWANAPKNADWRTLPICTVDATLVGPQVARYCTKYCSKDSGRDGGDDTFMLFSRGIGDSELMRLFNGKNYILDGREYPVPKLIWQREISNCYGVDFRYVSPARDPFVRVRARNKLTGRFIKSDVVRRSVYMREHARMVRDRHPAYQAYIAYWKKKNEDFEITRPSVFERIRALPNEKYLAYKAACIDYLNGNGDIVPPRSSSVVFQHVLWKRVYGSKYGYPVDVICRSACHLTANDTKGVVVVPYDPAIALDCLFRSSM